MVGCWAWTRFHTHDGAGREVHSSLTIPISLMLHPPPQASPIPLRVNVMSEHAPSWEEEPTPNCSLLRAWQGSLLHL